MCWCCTPSIAKPDTQFVSVYENQKIFLMIVSPLVLPTVRTQSEILRSLCSNRFSVLIAKHPLGPILPGFDVPEIPGSNVLYILEPYAISSSQSPQFPIISWFNVPGFYAFLSKSYTITSEGFQFLPRLYRVLYFQGSIFPDSKSPIILGIIICILYHPGPIFKGYLALYP